MSTSDIKWKRTPDWKKNINNQWCWSKKKNEGLVEATRVDRHPLKEHKNKYKLT